MAIGVWITSFSAGGAIGPLVGGVLLEHFWWGSVFLLAVPVMALLLVLGPRLLPEYRDPAAGPARPAQQRRSRSVAMLAVVYGLKQIGRRAASACCRCSPSSSGSGWASAFVRRQRRLADPLIDLRLFGVPRVQRRAGPQHPSHRSSMFGSFLFVAQYLQLVLGLSPLEAGLWTLPRAVGVRRRLAADARAGAPASGPAHVMAGGAGAGRRSGSCARPARRRDGRARLVVGSWWSALASRRCSRWPPTWS